MGIKKDPITGMYQVEYWKRHPKTRKPTRIARQGIKTKAEATRVYHQLIVETEMFGPCESKSQLRGVGYRSKHLVKSPS